MNLQPWKHLFHRNAIWIQHLFDCKPRFVKFFSPFHAAYNQVRLTIKGGLQFLALYLIEGWRSVFPWLRFVDRSLITHSLLFSITCTLRYRREYDEQKAVVVVFFFIFWASSFNHCLTALDVEADVEQPFDSLIVQNSQAVQFMKRSMDWTLEDNMVDGLFFCSTLTGRRGGHNPFVHAGAETSDTGAEAVKPDRGCSW